MNDEKHVCEQIIKFQHIVVVERLTTKMVNGSVKATFYELHM